MPERDSNRCAPLQPLLRAGDGKGYLGRLPLRLGEIRRIPVKLRFRQQAWKDFRVMARVCDICGKGPQFGNTISHAHNVSKRRWNVNLRPVHARVGAATKHIRVCTSCLRSGKVVKA
jgi:large subunit ribosomal protein L28